MPAWSGYPQGRLCTEPDLDVFITGKGRTRSKEHGPRGSLSGGTIAISLGVLPAACCHWLRLIDWPAGKGHGLAIDIRLKGDDCHFRYIVFQNYTDNSRALILKLVAMASLLFALCHLIRTHTWFFQQRLSWLQILLAVTVWLCYSYTIKGPFMCKYQRNVFSPKRKVNGLYFQGHVKGVRPGFPSQGSIES